MNHVEKSNRFISAFVICTDVLIINITFLLFNLFWSRYNPPIFTGSTVHILLTLSVSYLINSFFRESILYYRRVRPDQIVLKALGSMITFFLVWLFSISLLDFGISFERAMAVYFLFVTLLLITLRICYNSYLKFSRRRGKNGCNVVYIGGGSNLRELYDEMALELTTGYNVLGYFDKSPNPKVNPNCVYLGSEESVLEYLSSNQVDRVYCGLPSQDSEVIIPIINFCESHLVRFFSVPNFRNYCQRRVSLEMFSNVPLLTIRTEPLGMSVNKLVKRAFDVIFSLSFLLTAFLPIYIVVGIITKLTSPGPVFFKQKRHGLDGKEFYMYKFRSMKVNAQADTLQATKDDPRKTKFGNFLRKTSIDELPQFINVLLGDMSIVGPRPHMVKHTEEYSQLIKTYMVRHLIKPGVTGWAQVTGFRGETRELSEMEGRVKADIWYIEHWTFMLDLYII